MNRLTTSNNSGLSFSIIWHLIAPQSECDQAVKAQWLQHNSFWPHWRHERWSWVQSKTLSDQFVHFLNNCKWCWFITANGSGLKNRSRLFQSGANLMQGRSTEHDIRTDWTLSFPGAQVCTWRNKTIYSSHKIRKYFNFRIKPK